MEGKRPLTLVDACRCSIGEYPSNFKPPCHVIALMNQPLKSWEHLANLRCRPWEKGVVKDLGQRVMTVKRKNFEVNAGFATRAKARFRPSAFEEMRQTWAQAGVVGEQIDQF